MIGRVIVKDVNLVKKHIREIPNVREGGIYEIEAPIHISPLNHKLLFFLSQNALTSCTLPKVIHRRGELEA